MLDPKILSGLADPAPCFLCQDLSDDHSPKRYRVPLVHVPIDNVPSEKPPTNPAGAQQFLASLPDIESVRQLRALLSDGHGLGLFASKILIENKDQIEEGTIAHQALAGSLLIFSPGELDEVRADMKDWFFDGVDEAFARLPYKFDDIVPFAGMNFSPDRWFLIVRGPMAGRICWWTHDGDSVMDEPWAQDIADWGRRVWREIPKLFGGVIRFGGIESIDEVEEDVNLYPREYSPDGAH